jgi:phosphoserine phosphatase
MESASSVLVVDLDGTLTPTDTLWESVVTVLRHWPLALLLLPFWLVEGRARFKVQIAQRASLSPDLLPFNEKLVAYLREQRAVGRRLVLATAAHRSIADAVAAKLGFFDSVLASEGATNLKGARKLEAIQAQIGSNFSYAGDSRADLAIWRHAQSAVLVGVTAQVRAQALLTTRLEREFNHPTPSGRSQLAAWARALRVHQWLKNLLLVVPAFTSFSFESAQAWAALLTGFLAFSLLASATYILNDLLDLDSDRAHPRKRFRPFETTARPEAFYFRRLPRRRSTRADGPVERRRPRRF